MKHSKASRRKALARGLKAEQLAAKHLVALGWLELARRYKCPYGEIDLIFRNPDIQEIIFVEVKQRINLDQAAFAITLRTQKRISKAALSWFEQNNQFLAMSGRFDAILYNREFKLRHIKNAFDFIDDQQ